MTENHADHIKEHRFVIENPESKKDPMLVRTVLAHIQDHIDTWRRMDPALLMLTGQIPPPPPPMQVPTEPVMNGERPLPPQVLPDMPSLPPGSPPEAQAAYEKQKMELGEVG
jgi:hypothetical protein